MPMSEKNRKAVDIALEGGDYIAYLRDTGSKNPSAAWFSIKNQLQDKDPETYERLPQGRRKKAEKKPKKQKAAKIVSQEEPKTAAEAMENMESAADEFFGKVLQPEASKPAKIEKPTRYDGFTVREVEGIFARYRRSDVSEKTYIDVEISDGCDTISYTIEQWKSLLQEFKQAAAILGVEL